MLYIKIAHFCQQVIDLLDARAVEGRGNPVPYLQAIFKGKWS